MYHALLINPWIYDYAAVNMWARPLGLLKVAEFLSQFNLNLSYIDCMDRIEKPKPYGMGKYPKTFLPAPEFLQKIKRRYGRYGISLEEFHRRLKRLDKPDIVFITGIMTYWYPGAFLAIDLCKRLWPTVPVVLGGIYPSLFPEHARRFSGADLVYSGRVGYNLIDQLKELGISLKKVKEKPVPYYRLNFYPEPSYGVILSSEGCPFRCSYCASGILWKGFRQKSPEDILEEIEFQVSMGIRDFAFYDDALLYNRETHIKPLLKGIIEAEFNIRLHAPNGLHARYLDEELALLMKRAGFVTIRLSLETTNPERQKSTGGKVFNQELERAIKHLNKAGFGKKEIGVYLMYGLPGQELREVYQGVEYLKGLNVRIHLAEFSPLPGTHAWHELIEKGTLQHDIDPLLTNNTLFSLLFCSYKEEEIRTLKNAVSEYNRTS